jgi:AraC family transcriptional regulator of adaptative response / DNA-3-methyladenine glycosylase II
MPRARGRTLVTLAAALADGMPVERAALLALPGIGPWTADYVAMRALGDPDVFLPTDLGARRALGVLGATTPADPSRWSPWRSYALMHLWTPLDDAKEL